MIPIIIRNIGAKNLRINLPFRFNDETVYINFGLFDGDTSIFPFIIKKSGWEQYEVIKTSELLQENKSYDLVDLGANQGLFTIQLLKIINNNSKEVESSISNALLYEADSRLIPLIKENIHKNISSTIDIKIKNTAVSLKKGEVELILEKENTANNTLEPSAMANATSDEIKIKINSINAEDFEKDIQKHCSNPVIYKSDIQGTDIPFFLSLSDSMVSKIEVIIIEFWPHVLNSKSIDIRNFTSKMSDFKNVFILNNSGALVSSDINELHQLSKTNSSTLYFNIIASR